VQNPFAGCDVATSQIKLQRFGSASKKLIVIGESNNFLNEVRRIEAKMYLSETVVQRWRTFSSTTTATPANEKGPSFYEASEDCIRPCASHFVVAGR
jgi:hypothetical protein